MDIKITDVPVNNPRYTDDTVVLAGNIEDLQTMLIRVNTKGHQFGLKINRKKTN